MILTYTYSMAFTNLKFHIDLSNYLPYNHGEIQIGVILCI